MLARGRRHPKALVLLEDHQAFGLEPHQHFPERADPYAAALAKALNAQALVRHQPARHDVDADLTENLGVDRLLDSAVVLLDKGHSSVCSLLRTERSISLVTSRSLSDMGGQKFECPPQRQ